VQRALSLNPGNKSALYGDAMYLLAIRGNRAEARAELRIGQELDPLSDISNFTAAWLHLFIGDIDRTFEWLEKCFEEKDGKLFWLAVVPLFQPLRADTRFESFLRRLGLKATLPETRDPPTNQP
jgi:hypothetical protein